MTTAEVTVETADIHTQLRDLVAIAIDLGWSARNYTVGRKLGVVLRRMHEGRTVEVPLPPTKSLKDGTISQMYARVRRFSDPAQVAIKGAISGQAKDESLSTEQRDAAFRDALPSGLAVAHGETALAAPAPHIVSEAPRLAKGGTGAKAGRFYESDAVIERKWSDGSSDFACAWSGCDFTSPSHLTVSSHYARSASHQLVPDPVIIAGPSYLEGDPRIDRLAAQIMEAADLLDKGADATALAAKMIELRDAAKGEDDAIVSPRELTAEERLERILRLADGGRYLEAVEDNRQWQERIRLTEECIAELDAALAERAQLTDEYAIRAQQAIDQRDVAVARAAVAAVERDKAVSTLTALRELVAEA